MDELPSFDLPVERSAALVRGFWRLIPVSLGVGILLNFRSDWRLLWLTDKASFLAVGFLFLFVLAVTLAVLWSAGRWLVLAFWRRELGIRVTPEEISLSLGPFGEHRHAWRDVRVEIDSSIDPEMLEMMPDDAFVPRLLHRSADGDLSALMQRFSRTPSETLTRLLRPYVRRALGTRNPGEAGPK